MSEQKQIISNIYFKICAKRENKNILTPQNHLLRKCIISIILKAASYCSTKLVNYITVETACFLEDDCKIDLDFCTDLKFLLFNL